MAVAASGIAILGRTRVGDPGGSNLQFVVTTITFTGSYVTAGEVPTSSSWEAVLGLGRIFAAFGNVGEGGPPPTLLLTAQWNPVTSKLQLFTSNGAGPASLAEKTAAAYGTAPTGQIAFVGV
jgi:hypothetical protein